MPISNLNNPASHGAVKVKDEYAAKHEAGVAGKMASVWENKTATLDGGRLPDTFGKDPRTLAAERRGPKSPPHKESADVDAGPNQTGPVASKKRSVVEMKAAFDSMAEKEKREIEQREAEKRSREEASSFLRSRSNGNESAMPRTKSGVEANSTLPPKEASDDEVRAIAETIQVLESQARELSETVAKLKSAFQV